MNKILFILLTLFICLISHAQIINIPDANFKAKLLEADSGVGIAYGIGGSFKIDANDNGEIEVDEVLLVSDLQIKNSNITDLTGIEFFTNLDTLRCEDNLIAELNVTMLPNLRTLSVYNNSLTSLNITGLSNLRNLYASDNLLITIDLTGLIDLRVLRLGDNQLSSLDFSETPNLYSIDCFNNQLIALDISSVSELIFMNCSSNPLLETLNVKNEFSEYNIDFSNNDNLQYICADDEQVIDIENQIAAFGYTNCYVNSLCSFVQGEEFYQFSGHVNYDEDENGCDAVDIEYPQLMFSYTDGVNTGTAFADENGFYTSSMQAGNYTFTPVLLNPTYFSVSPTNKTISFPEDVNSNTQDFCVSPNGIYPDFKITMDGDLSGYDTFVSYRIKYTNQGTMTQSGSIDLNFDNTMALFNSSSPMISSQSGNELTWSFLDLKPFESRDIEFIMDLSAVEENMYGEMIVNYVASINSNFADTTPSDNVFEFSQPFFCCLLNTVDYSFDDYFVLYPNPTRDILNLKMKKDVDIKTVELYTILGQKVKTVAIKNRNSSIGINVSNLDAGHYFIKIITSETIFTTRFIKSN